MKYFIAIASLLLCFSCASPTLEFEKPSGRTNEIKSGGRFHVNLPEDHKTGYSWSVQSSYDATVVQYMGSVFHSTEPGTVDFHFEAMKPGKTEISFYLRKHQDTSAVKTFLLEVK